MKKKKTVFNQAAKDDLKDALKYYKKINPELATAMKNRTSAIVERIQNSPEQFPKIYKNVRRALLKRFPYMLLYVIQPIENVVIGVFHQQSNPNKWKNRADKD